jgi:hypothetical protein
MKHTLPIALVALLISMPSLAANNETVLEWSGVTDRKQTKANHFRVGEKSEHTLSLSLDSSREGVRPFIRLCLFSVDDEGRETEMKKYRVQLEKKQKHTSDTFTLKPGRYVFRLEVRDADYMVKVERPKKDG